MAVTKSRASLTLPLTVAIVAAVAVSLAEGAPDRMPGVALGSMVLLHVERSAAIFAIVVAVTSVLSEASRGRLPTQLSTAGLAYVAQDTGDATARIQAGLDDVQRQLQSLAELRLGDEERPS